MQSPVFGVSTAAACYRFPFAREKARHRHPVPMRGGANDVFASSIAIIVLTLVVPWEVPTAAGLLAYHAEGEVKHGASRKAIAETLAMATYVGAGPSVMYAAEA